MHGGARGFALGRGARRSTSRLTTARQLQRRGFDVTIYAATVPPDTTSNMSLAGFTPPTALVNNTRRTPAWDAQLVRAAEISYRQLQFNERNLFTHGVEFGVGRNFLGMFACR